MSEEKKPGIVREFLDVFKGKLKELSPIESAVVFVIVGIVMTFGIVGFTSAIASGVVKMIQAIAAVAVATGV